MFSQYTLLHFATQKSTQTRKFENTQSFIFLLDFLILGPIYFLTRTMTKSLAVAPQPNPRNPRLKNRRQMALVVVAVAAASGSSSTATTWQKPSRTSRNRKRESSLWRRTLSRSGHGLNSTLLAFYIRIIILKK